MLWKEARCEFPFSLKSNNVEDEAKERILMKTRAVYSTMDCLKDILSCLSYHARDYYTASIARKRGNSLGGLFKISSPSTVVQPTSLTFRLLGSLVTELTSNEAALLSLLNICFQQISIN